MINITMRQMLEAGVHFGHQTRYWNPKMAPYIYGVRHNVHILNLEHTLPMFKEALQFVHQIIANRGKVLFVGTKFAARDIVREEASRCGMPYVNYRWLGGMLTNYKTIRQSIKRLKDMEILVADEEAMLKVTKKERLNLLREKQKLETVLDGIKNMGSLPDVLFLIDVDKESIAIQEAKRLGIPVIGVADTNSSPEGIDYLVPGNDDALRAIRFYCAALADTILEARGEPEVEVEKTAEKKAVVTKKIVTKKAAPKAKEALDNSSSAPAKKKVVAEKKPVAKKKVAAKKNDATTTE